MPTALRIVGIINPDNFADYMNSAPGSIGERILVFQITPNSIDDLPGYKYMYDTLLELNTFAVIHDRECESRNCLPAPVNTFTVIPLAKDSPIPCDLSDDVQPCKLPFNYVF